MQLLIPFKWLIACAATILRAYIVFAQYDGPMTTLSSEQVSDLINTIFETKEPSCNCIPMNMCQKYKNSTINTSGEGLIDIRYSIFILSIRLYMSGVEYDYVVWNTPPFV